MALGQRGVGQRGVAWRRLCTVGLLILASAGAWSARAAASPGLSVGQPLTGVFSIAAGKCSTAATAPSGSYLQLTEHGVPVPNSSSPCLTYTPLTQGTQGLVSGAYQLDPSPTFDAKGNSLANGVFTPVTFLGTRFGGATTCADQQHSPTATGRCTKGTTFAAPQLYAEPIGVGGCTAGLLSSVGNPSGLLDADCLYGNLIGFGVTWNGTPGGSCASSGAAGCYDQGASTDSSLQTTRCVNAPTTDCSITGSYNPTTHAYTLTLKAQVVGTSFNGATGIYHLTGVFSAKSVRTSTSSAGGGSQHPKTTRKHSTGKTSTQRSAGSHHSTTTSQPKTSRYVTLAGTLHIATGSCAGSGPPNGSWIQLSKGGGAIANPNSSCDGGNYTPVAQGSTGFVLGSFQPNPVPTFDGAGNSLAGAILTPTDFLGSKFGAATNAQNEQTAPNGAAVYPAPSAVVEGSSLSVNASSVNFTYNGSPNGTCASGGGTGCYAVGSSSASGTFDSATGNYVLGWTATIVGGAFNGASATFHLVGQFVGRQITHVVAAGAAPPPASAGGGGSGTSAVSATSPTGTGAGSTSTGSATIPGSASSANQAPAVPGSALPQTSGGATSAGTPSQPSALGQFNLTGSGTGSLPWILELISLVAVALAALYALRWLVRPGR